jgi:enoyl-[acyl-carrier protein] reductase I
MSDKTVRPLSGKKALVIGIANDQSIAYGCARAFRRQGAELAITYLNEKARRFVEPLARELEAPIFLPLNVQEEGQFEAVFEAIRQNWGRLDIALHSIAFAPKDDLQGGLLNCSLDGFLTATDISCHSFIRMARLAVPLMTEGGTLLAMTFLGSAEVVPNYNVMGPVKAALESVVRYLASELGPRRIRVHAISPGPVATRAASGLKEFDQLLDASQARSPLGELVDIDDVGAVAAFLASPQARRITGTIQYVDAGLNITG